MSQPINAASKTQRKLERLELEHLRQLATSLHEQLEQAIAAKEYAYQSAEMWAAEAALLREAMADENFVTHRKIGLTKTGELLVVAA